MCWKNTSAPSINNDPAKKRWVDLPVASRSTHGKKKRFPHYEHWCDSVSNSSPRSSLSTLCNTNHQAKQGSSVGCRQEGSSKLTTNKSLPFQGHPPTSHQGEWVDCSGAADDDTLGKILLCICENLQRNIYLYEHWSDSVTNSSPRSSLSTQH